MDIWTKEDFDQTIEAIKVQQARNYEGDINAPRIHILHQEIKVSYTWMLYEQVDLTRLLNEMEDWFGPGKIDFQDESTPERKRWDLIQYKLGVFEDILPLVRPTVSFLDEYLAPEHSPKEASQNIRARHFPSELSSSDAKLLLDKLIAAGFCTPEFHWNGSFLLLAYFAERASEHLGLGKGIRNEIKGKDVVTRPRTAWRPFETLFGVKGLRFASSNIRNKTEIPPNGYEKIDALFK